ncbi:MAG: Crp/Fnr family transcriptional regulator [Thermonemataceae bacterium]
MAVILASIKSLSQGSPEEVQVIFDSLKKSTVEKGAYLLKEGRICTQYYFVEEGAIRLFFTKDELDYTVWIGTPGEVFTNLESYLDASKSNINIQALENSIVYVINKAESDRLAEKSNTYNTLLRKTVEMAFINLSKNVMSFQSEEAAERYNRVMKEKNWILKYPLKYISTFIGVTQSTLSRIRATKK